ncbi:SDH family Clp fold serine proteinase [Thiomicrospira microaerophila]|uniref:SDH family Clp fold serine proteinase n=1 Tax=Thiomicrospira microaerophila TaxID=406020 RepID=UPI0005C8D99A|nr:serine protease [Thiomicrospira microaerophila]
MPSWNDVLDELSFDGVRRKYLRKLHEHTGRNVIAYYSGWLQKPNSDKASIYDGDKNGFMNAVYGLDRTIGLDLILHTPGGDVAATESIVHYLREMFGEDVRVIVPQIAMSAGTMIACSAKSVLLGKHSNLGPIDPHIGGLPTFGVINEFERAIREVKEDPDKLQIWQLIVGKYHPTFLGACQNAIDLSTQMVTDWLQTGMFAHNPDAHEMAERVVKALNNHDDTKSHARHIHMDEAKEIGLIIEELEESQDLQDLVLTVHHAYMHTLSNSPAIKIIENHSGQALVENIPYS